MDSRKNAIDADHDFDFYLKHDIPAEQMRTMLKAKKMSDDKVDDMVNRLIDTRERVKKYARKFIQKMEQSYGYYDVPTIVQKAYKYCEKHKLSVAERDAVVDAAIRGDVRNTYNPLNEVKYSEMSKFMGIESPTGQVLNLQSKDYAVLSEIVKLYETSKILHMDVKNQLILYQDCDPHALKGKYDVNRHNITTHIHPLIVSLFAPKIQAIENRMLISNIGRIVLMRSTPYVNKHIRLYDNLMRGELESEWHLTTDIVYDPNSLAYFSEDTPITNMLKRFRIQIELWKNVINLRQGKFYSMGYDTEDGINGLLRVLSQYDWTFFDSPEMYHIQDEGTILRKLLAVFSIRPTIAKVVSNIPGSLLNTGNLTQMARTTFVRVPIINVRLPYNSSPIYINNNPIDIPQPQNVRKVTLSGSLDSQDFFFENKAVVPKTRTVVMSNDLLFFYVNRRQQGPAYAQTNFTFNYTVVPYHNANLSQTTVNETAIGWNPQLTIGGNVFNCKSVVTVYRPPISNDGNAAILAYAGSSAVIMCESMSVQDKAYYYNPMTAHLQPEQYAITAIDYNNNSPIDVIGICSMYGTVFTFTK
jgi:hypothetical protein